MQAIQLPTAGNILFILDPDAVTSKLHRLIALQACRGPIRVIDSSNRFDAFTAARHIREQTPLVRNALRQIQAQRAFTCYQLLTLLDETPPSPVPAILLDPLTHFYDENIALAERLRLLDCCIRSIRRTSESAAIIISCRRRPHHSESPILLEMLQACATISLHIPQVAPGSPPAQLPGFQS